MYHGLLYCIINTTPSAWMKKYKKAQQRRLKMTKALGLCHIETDVISLPYSSSRVTVGGFLILHLLRKQSCRNVPAAR